MPSTVGFNDLRLREGRGFDRGATGIRALGNISVKGLIREPEDEEALRRENQALRKEVKDVARLHYASWRLQQAESLREGLAEVLSVG